MTDIVLQNYDLDARCYIVRLFLSLLGLDYTTAAVDAFPGREHLTSAFLAMNPAGTLPVLRDGALTLFEPEAILGYAARRYDAAGTWLPLAPEDFARVMQWVVFAARDLAVAETAREQALFGSSGLNDGNCEKVKRFLELMEDHMLEQNIRGQDWFAAPSPTIADIALFPAFALSRDIGIDHNEFAALRRWSRRLRGLPGFITMPGIPDFG